MKDKNKIWINRFIGYVTIEREFKCLECGKTVKITDRNDKRTKYCSMTCCRHYISRGHRQPIPKGHRKKIEPKTIKRIVFKDTNNTYYFIENGIKYRCLPNGYKRRELYEDDLLCKKSKAWTMSDVAELIKLKESKIYKDRDIALLLERPVSAIREKYYRIKKKSLSKVNKKEA